MIRVLLADDQALVRAGFRMLLEACDDIEVVGEAPHGGAAVAMARELRPDVVLMDLRMPDVDGLTATQRISADPGLASVKVIVLTTFDDDEHVFGALRAGASGFLVKDVEPDELLQAVRVVARGDALLSPGVTRSLIAAFAAIPPGTAPGDVGRGTQAEPGRDGRRSQGAGPDWSGGRGRSGGPSQGAGPDWSGGRGQSAGPSQGAGPGRSGGPGQPGTRAGGRRDARQPGIDSLTEREREVVALVAAGLSNEEIAAKLVVSPLTAKTHVSRSMTKLAARDRAQLVVIAYETGLATPAQPA